METVTLGADHASLAREAFEGLMARRPREYASYLADPALLSFHSEKILDRLGGGGGGPLWGVIEGNQLLALGGTSKSPWHEEHYGVPFRKVQPFFWFLEGFEGTREAMERMTRALCAEPGAVYTLRIEAKEPALPHCMGALGWMHAGTSVRMEMDEKTLDRAIGMRLYSTRLSIRELRSGDLPHIRRIAETSHRHSHFFREERFSREKTQELFGLWLERCAEGKKSKILVADRQGEVAGFASLMLNEGLMERIGKAIGIIDFIVVDGRFQGEGIGGSLLNASILWFKDRADIVELRTMADNIQAIRFYEANRFRMLSADQYYHFWT